MKLVSTTVCGNAEKSIAAMVLSVRDWVDQIVLLDTGVTDATIHLARTLGGDKVVVVPFAWCDDFSAARNAALDAAAKVCGDSVTGLPTLDGSGSAVPSWCVMVDTDETIQIEKGVIDPLGLVHHMLANAHVDHISIDHESRIYGQPRFFRLPAKGRFEGPTHEAYPGASLGCIRTSRIVFCDKPKSEAALKQKLERDLVILQKHTIAHPLAPRWFYYLGDTLANLGRETGAIDAFEQCYRLNGWNEESAWACYRLCICWGNLSNWEKVVEWAINGLRRHAGIAENAWQAAFGYYKLGNMRQATYWAHLARVHGYFDGDGKSIDRQGFKWLPALYEKPFEVLRYAHESLGDKGLSEGFASDHALAVKAREEWVTSGGERK